MKKIITLSLLSCCLLAATTSKGFGAWEKYTGAAVPTKGEQRITPAQYQVFSLQDSYFKGMLFSLPNTPEQGQVISLPTPDGGMKNYKVWRYSMMEQRQADKYPGIATFMGYAEGNQKVTIRLDYTYKGFHAMVFDGGNTYLINPYSELNDGFYICYYKKDLTRNINQVMTCEVKDDLPGEIGESINLTQTGLPPLQFKTHGTVLKEYRLALACTGEYAIAVAGATPTKADVLSAMVTSINRINGVFEKEIAVRLNMIANDTLIHLISGYDAVDNPYSNNNGSTMLNQNQNVITARIGAANYDMGHVFSTNGGGIASLGCVCDNTDKARGVTGNAVPIGDGFDIDYVAHEMGHQFNAPHTFNANTGSCSGNGSSGSAYEPGSGSTIMAYAGICTGNDLQTNSDAYFHAKSLDDISTYINNATGGGGTCPVETPTNNVVPVIPPYTAIYQVPEKTPFEITAPEAQDEDHDSLLTYCWEQWNRGNFGQSFTAVRTRGPIFRSFLPTTSRTRVFPVMSKVLQGITNYMGEKLPDTTRYLTFRLTVRDVLNGIGSFNFSTDTIHLDVTETAGPFVVTSQPTAVTLNGGNYHLVTWDVAGTDQPPVSCDSVVVYMSDDGGLTFDHILNPGTPNDGSEMIFFPNFTGLTITTARLKVKAKNNVFFNVNASNFTVQYDPTSVEGVQWADEVAVFPVPATEQLQITNKHNSALNISILNAVGQQVWQGAVQQQVSIPVSAWASGVYYLQATDAKGDKIVKPVVIQ